MKKEITTFGCMNGGLYSCSYPPPSVQTISGKKEEPRIYARSTVIERRIRKAILQSRLRSWLEDVFTPILSFLSLCFLATMKQEWLLYHTLNPQCTTALQAQVLMGWNRQPP